MAVIGQTFLSPVNNTEGSSGCAGNGGPSTTGSLSIFVPSTASVSQVVSIGVPLVQTLINDMFIDTEVVCYLRRGKDRSYPMLRTHDPISAFHPGTQ